MSRSSKLTTTAPTRLYQRGSGSLYRGSPVSRSGSRSTTSSDASAPPQHYLKTDRRWNRYSQATTFSWFDRVSTLEKGVNIYDVWH